MLGQTNAKLTLDASQFDSENKKAQSTAEATERALKEASKRTAEAQAVAAKYAADTVSEQGRRILDLRAKESQSTRDLAAVMKASQRGYLDEAQASNAAAAAIQRQVAARQALANLSRSDHSDVTNRQASSALLRGGGLRADETFLASIPGAGRAVQALFPLIGGAGLAGLLFEMGQKGAEAFQKVRQAAEATRQAFADAHDKAQISIDDKAIENQKIQDQIDKISKRPNNGLATALLEARKMADQLVVSLQEDRKQLDALFKENSTGKLGSALSVIGVGPAGTGQQEDELLKDEKALRQQVRSAGMALNDEMSKAGDDAGRKRAVDRYNKSVHDAFQSQIDTYKTESGRLVHEEQVSAADLREAAKYGYSLPVPDNSVKKENIEGRIGQLQDLQTTASLDASIYAGNTKLGQLKQDKPGKDDTNKQAEAQFKGFEDMLNRRKQVEQLTVTDEINFWEAMMAPAARYAANIQKIDEKLGPLNQEYYRQLGTAADKASEAQRKAAEAVQRTDERALAIMTQWERQIDESARALDTLNAAERKNADEMADWVRKQAEATGVLSRRDAAMQAAAEHAAEYAAQLAAIDEEQKRVAGSSTLDPEERSRRNAQLDTQRVNVTGARDRQAAQDQLAIYDTTKMAAVNDAITKFNQQTGDMAQILGRLTSDTLSKVNSTLLQTITSRPQDRRGAFTNLGKGLATDVAGASLNYGESTLMKALGLGKGKGKPTGAQGDPLWVRTANSDAALNSVSGSAAGNLASKLTKGSGDDSDNDSGGSKSGGLLGSILGLLPGFASGGFVSAGTMAMVGEHGPEPVYFGQDARVFPHGTNVGGGGGSINVNVDARGSASPAMVSAAAHDAAREGARRGHEAALRSQQEQRRRQLGGVRRG